LVLNPQIVSFFIPLKVQLIKGMYLSVSPAMLMGWVTGDYDDGYNYLEFTPKKIFEVLSHIIFSVIFFQIRE
jgi:hypothetical protein